MAEEVPVSTPTAPAVESASPAPAAPDGAAPVTPEGDEAAKAQAEEQQKQEKLYTKEQTERFLQKRLRNERARIKAEVENEYLRRQVTERAAPPVESQAANPSGEPKPSQYEDYESYIKAQARWEIRQELEGMNKRTQEQRNKAEQARQSHTLLEKIVAPGETKYGEEFRDVVLSEDTKITEPMLAAMVETDVAPDIAYFLGTHQDEAARIAGLSPANQVRAIDKIAATLTKPPEPTKAPAPITPNAAKGSVPKDPKDMSYSEFVAWRRRSIAAKAA